MQSGAPLAPTMAHWKGVESGSALNGQNKTKENQEQKDPAKTSRYISGVVDYDLSETQCLVHQSIG